MEILMKKDKHVAAILAFFFGWIGLHSIYLGRRFQFILYASVSGFFLAMEIYRPIALPWLIAIIQGFRIGFLGWYEFNSKYNRED